MEHLNESTGQPSSPLAALGRYWYVAVLTCLIGGGAGFAAAQSQDTSYVAESRLSVGSGELAAYQVPGFALAAQELAANYARYLSSSPAAVDLTTLGPAAGEVTGVRASPIPNSSVLRIEVTATDRQAARLAAERVAVQLRDRVTASSQDPDSVSQLQAYTEVSAQVAAAQTASDQARQRLTRLISQDADPTVVQSARTTLNQAVADLSVTQLKQSAIGAEYEQAAAAGQPSNQLVVLGAAAVTSSDARSRFERYVLGGVVGGLLAAMALATALDRRRARRDRDSRPVITNDLLELQASDPGAQPEATADAPSAHEPAHDVAAAPTQAGSTLGRSAQQGLTPGELQSTVLVHDPLRTDGTRAPSASSGQTSQESTTTPDQDPKWTSSTHNGSYSVEVAREAVSPARPTEIRLAPEVSPPDDGPGYTPRSR